MKHRIMYSLLGLIALTATALLETADAQASPPVATAPEATATAQKYPEVRKPTNANELLTNIKLAIDEDLFSKKWFYARENIFRFLGVEDPDIDERDGMIRLWSRQFGYMPAEPYPKGGRFNTGLSGGIIQEKECGVGMVFADGAPVYQDVEEVFGSDWKYRDFGSNWRYSEFDLKTETETETEFGPVTGPHGNRTLIYQRGTPPRIYRIVISFYADGSVYGLSVGRQF